MQFRPNPDRRTHRPPSSSKGAHDQWSSGYSRAQEVALYLGALALIVVGPLINAQLLFEDRWIPPDSVRLGSVVSSSLAWLFAYVAMSTAIMRRSAATPILGISILLIISISIVTSLILGYANLFHRHGVVGSNGVTHDPYTALYLSIITWTTVGYGDVRPTDGVRLVAAIESLVAYIVSAIFLGQLVAFVAARDRP